MRWLPELQPAPSPLAGCCLVALDASDVNPGQLKILALIAQRLPDEAWVRGSPTGPAD